ncbi:MAG: CopG family antitoxin [Caldilineaceae bacterium]
MPKLPDFQSDEELINWFDSHDTADYIDEMEPAEMDFEVIRTPFLTSPVDLRLRSDFLNAIETLAQRRGIPYQLLIQAWLQEKLSQEAPELMPTH